MTTAIHHGDPGSFKSFGTIQRVVIPSFCGKHEGFEEGRIVVSNIRGLDSIKKIEKALDIKCSPESEVINVNSDSNQGYAMMACFFHWVPKGALIVIDETQKVYNKRRHRNLGCYDLTLKDQYDNPLGTEEELKEKYPFWDGDYDRPANVEEAFDQHRHYNWDIYCITPNISKLHPEVREVAEIAYRHRPRGILVPWWKNHWKEFAHDAEFNGKSTAHYEGTPKKYKADKRIFSCYKSTKTGKAKSTTETRSIFRDPKVIIPFLLFFMLVPYFVSTASEVFAQKKAAISGTPNASDSSEVHLENGAQVSSSESRVVPASSGNHFSDLEARFANASVNTSEGPRIDPVIYAKHLTSESDLRLSALLTASKGRLYYRVSSYDSDGNLLDEYTQNDLSEMGYTVKKVGSGIQIMKDDISFSVRRWVVSGSRSNSGAAAMQGDSVQNVMAKSLPF